MKYIKNLLILLWRVWFYLWVFSTIILCFPFLIIILSKESWYLVFYKMAHYWAKTTLFVMGFTPQIKNCDKIIYKNSYMFCPNHTSMIDIFLILAITKTPFVFIGKKELVKIPVFGYIYKRTCIMVDRNNQKSRLNAYKKAQKKLETGLSICIFPEGKVPDDESVILDEFQNGAFRLAIEFKIPLVPITFYDCKKRFSYTFFSGGPGKLRVKRHKQLITSKLNNNDKNLLKNKTHDIIYKELTSNFALNKTKNNVC